MPIYLIRHAHTICNGPPKIYQGRLDVGLSEGGADEARELASSLKIPDRIVTSSSLRCRETVENYLQGRSIELEFDDRLWEIDNGWFSGKTEEEIKNIDSIHFEKWVQNPTSVRPGGGESLQEMQNRVFAAIKDIFTSNENRTTYVFTHGGVIRCFLLAYNNEPLDNFHKLHVANLAFIELDENRLCQMYSEDINTSS